MNTNNIWPPAPGKWVIAAVVWIAMIGSAYAIHLDPDLDPRLSLSLLGGAFFGAFLQRSRFCFYCNTRDYFESRQIGGLMALLAALATGLLGYHTVFGAFLPDPGVNVLPPGAHIGPVSPVLAIGALLFGFGMALSGSCISAQFYRLGEGAWAGLIVLAGVFIGFIVGFWLWNPLYLWTIQSAPVVWFPALLGYGGSLLVQLGVLAFLALILVRTARPAPVQPATSLPQSIFAKRWPGYVGGILIGALATVMYLRIAPLGVTAELGSIARTLGAQLPAFPARLEGLDQFRGCITAVKETWISHNGLFVLALIAGSFASALPAGDFKPAWPELKTLPRFFVGGILMGTGAMIALGCTVGTLLSGIMAGALSGWVFAVFCFIGTWLGWKLRVKYTY